MNQELITESADEYFVKRLYNSKNENDFIEGISLTDWSEMYGASDTQGAFDQFHNTLMELYNKNFPKVRMKQMLFKQKTLAIWSFEKLYQMQK